MLPRTFTGGNGNGGRIRREKKDSWKRRGDHFSEVISLISDLTGLLQHSSSLPHTHQPAENTHFQSFLSHWEPLYDFITHRHTNTSTGSHTGAQSLETHMQSCTEPWVNILLHSGASLHMHTHYSRNASDRWDGFHFRWRSEGLSLESTMCVMEAEHILWQTHLCPLLWSSEWLQVSVSLSEDVIASGNRSKQGLAGAKPLSGSANQLLVLTGSWRWLRTVDTGIFPGFSRCSWRWRKTVDTGIVPDFSRCFWLSEMTLITQWWWNSSDKQPGTVNLPHKPG